MVPKGPSVVESNESSKGLSWVDRMYQKFEHICEEVDKNPSHLIQETTKFVENRVSIAGANVRKLCAEVIHEILPPSPEVAIKSLSSIINVDLEEEFNLSEKSKPDPEKTNSLITNSVDSCNLKQEVSELQKEPDSCFSSDEICPKSFPFNHQGAESDISCSNMSGQLSPPSLQEELAVEKQAMPLNMEASNCTEDPRGVQETASFVFAESMMRQRRETIQLDVIEHPEKKGKTSLEETPNMKEGRILNLKDGIRVLTTVEPLSADHFSKINRSLDESEQSAFWYEADSIDISTSNLFYKVTDVEKYSSAENCDSEWELL